MAAPTLAKVEVLRNRRRETVLKQSHKTGFNCDFIVLVFWLRISLESVIGFRNRGVVAFGRTREMKVGGKCGPAKKRDVGLND